MDPSQLWPFQLWLIQRRVQNVRQGLTNQKLDVVTFPEILGKRIAWWRLKISLPPCTSTMIQMMCIVCHSFPHFSLVATSKRKRQLKHRDINFALAV
jgi:hypothetical protein